jgi:hypothetical protein
VQHTSFASAWILAKNIAAGVTCELNDQVEGKRHSEKLVRIPVR